MLKTKRFKHNRRPATNSGRKRLHNKEMLPSKHTANTWNHSTYCTLSLENSYPSADLALAQPQPMQQIEMPLDYNLRDLDLWLPPISSSGGRKAKVWTLIAMQSGTITQKSYDLTTLQLRQSLKHTSGHIKCELSAIMCKTYKASESRMGKGKGNVHEDLFYVYYLYCPFYTFSNLSEVDARALQKLFYGTTNIDTFLAQVN